MPRFSSVTLLASGVIPQISGIFGPCAGGAVYSPALTDFTLMMEGTSYMFLTGPKVVKTVTGEDVSQEDLGGASVHSTRSGVTHFTASTEEEGLALIRKLLSYIPQNNLEEPPYVDCTDPIDRLEDSLNEIVPDSPNKAYDMYEVIGAIVDNGEFLEIQRDFAKNIIIGFARFNGQSVGIVANSRSSWPVCSIATLRVRQPVSFVSAMRSTFLSCHLWMCRDSCREPDRNTMQSSCTVRSCCMLTAKLRCLK